MIQNDAVGSGTLFARVRSDAGAAGEWDMVFSSSGRAVRGVAEPAMSRR